MPFKGLFLLSGMIICSFYAQANNSANAEVTLSIKPIVCMVKHKGQPCQMTVTAAWQSDIPLDLCLVQNDQQLDCWRQTKQVKQQFDISLTSDMLFQLKDQHGEIKASQQVKLNVANNTQYRRRLRAQWSLF